MLLLRVGKSIAGGSPHAPSTHPNSDNNMPDCPPRARSELTMAVLSNLLPLLLVLLTLCCTALAATERIELEVEIEGYFQAMYIDGTRIYGERPINFKPPPGKDRTPWAIFGAGPEGGAAVQPLSSLVRLNAAGTAFLVRSSTTKSPSNPTPAPTTTAANGRWEVTKLTLRKEKQKEAAGEQLPTHLTVLLRVNADRDFSTGSGLIGSKHPLVDGMEGDGGSVWRARCRLHGNLKLKVESRSHIVGTTGSTVAREAGPLNSDRPREARESRVLRQLVQFLPPIAVGVAVLLPVGVPEVVVQVGGEGRDQQRDECQPRRDAQHGVDGAGEDARLVEEGGQLVEEHVAHGVAVGPQPRLRLHPLRRLQVGQLLAVHRRVEVPSHLFRDQPAHLLEVVELEVGKGAADGVGEGVVAGSPSDLGRVPLLDDGGEGPGLGGAREDGRWKFLNL